MKYQLQTKFVDSWNNDLPVNADDDEDARWEDVSSSPDHHQHLAQDVATLPLYSQPPQRLHGQGDEADDGVGQGEVEHEVVNIGAALGLRHVRLLPGDDERDAVENHPNWKHHRICIDQPTTVNPKLYRSILQTSHTYLEQIFILSLNVFTYILVS